MTTLKKALAPLTKVSASLHTLIEQGTAKYSQNTSKINILATANVAISSDREAAERVLARFNDLFGVGENADD